MLCEGARTRQGPQPCTFEATTTELATSKKRAPRRWGQPAERRWLNTHDLGKVEHLFGRLLATPRSQHMDGNYVLPSRRTSTTLG